MNNIEFNGENKEFWTSQFNDLEKEFDTLKEHTFINEEKALFVTQNAGLRLSLRTVGGIVEQAVKKSGIAKRVTPHTFRHSMATHMLRNRADLRHIQAILGHASFVSPEIYTHMSLEHMKEVVRRAHPHGKRQTKPSGFSTRKQREGRSVKTDLARWPIAWKVTVKALDNYLRLNSFVVHIATAKGESSDDNSKRPINNLSAAG